MVKFLKKKASIIGVFLVALTTCSLMIQHSFVKASTEGNQSADLRLIFTSDIHGQLNSTDYETGSTLSVGGLSRAYNLIKQARGETSNSLTFDIGDVIYDYTTEYFYSEHQSTVQPIYEAMSLMGYDAVTLGNHEFDYDYDYLVSQLKSSGMFEKVVVSNLTESKSGKYPFLENMIITKELTTFDGGTLQVNVGVIGETLPVLSLKGQDFTGVLKVQDIVENVTEQAAKLKQQGADIIVVLSHSGMGVENPAYLDKNVSYALTKIEDVDAVLCGHEHNAFPSTDTSGAYYKLSGVDKSTNLVNGKNLVMAQDRGRSIGVVDFTLELQDGEIVITDRSSELRQVTSKNTVEESSIATLYDDYSSDMLEYTKEVIGSVAKEDLIENFNGLVEDNTAIQLLNDAKRSYALNYIHNKVTEYIGYPVIAASSYVSYGENGYLDYVNTSGELTESDLASLQGYNGYTAIYKITGAQLKEWIEWSASAYMQTTSKETWNDTTMGYFMKSTSTNPLLNQDWLGNWSNFYVFDGVEYTINPMIAARYNQAGVKVNSSNRVVDLTYNGEPVTDDQVFVLAVGKLAKTTEANVGIDKQAIYKGYVKTQGIIRDYIEQRVRLGSLDITPDYNWTISLPNNYQFLVRTTSIGEEQLMNSTWFVKQLGTKDNYIYSVGNFDTSKTKATTKILLSATYNEATSDKVKVAVAATSKAGVVTVKYLKGDYEATSNIWNTATVINQDYFYADGNDIYSVYVVDGNGVPTVEKIKIDNIYSGALKKPSVNTYTNRKTKLTGTAEPGSTIVIETMKKTYRTTADTSGAFSCTMPAQDSGTSITVYAVNEVKNHISAEVVVKVKRTGPNQPTILGAFNNSDQITGNLNDSDASVLAIVGTKVYVGDEDTAELYRNCSTLYNEEYEVVVTSERIDADYNYMLTVPVQKVGTQISVYTIDHINRSSMVNTVKVQDVAPNPPEVYELVAADNKIEGKVTASGKNKIFTVCIAVKNKNYVVSTDKYGYFCVDLDPEMLTVGTKIRVSAKDTVNYINRTSYTTEITVQDPEVFVSDNNDLALDYLLTGEKVITGYNDSTDEVTVAVYHGGSYRVYEAMPNDEGRFSIDLDLPLRKDDIIYAHTRAANGNLLDMVKGEIQVTVPRMPILDSEITNLTTTVIAYSDVEGTMVVKIGDKKYESSECFYNELEEGFQFNIPILQTPSKTKVSVYCYNEEGKSDARDITVEYVVPEAPIVNPVYTTTKKIKGTITADEDSIIYAKIGTEVYTGTIKANGSFVIAIPVQEAKQKIVIWAENEDGVGIQTAIQVVKKVKKVEEPVTPPETGTEEPIGA